MKRETVNAIDNEMMHLPHDLTEIAAWLLMIESRLHEAKSAWDVDHNNEETLKKILETGACCIRCLENQ